MRNGAHFCYLRDSFMSRLYNFVNTYLLETHHACQLSHFLNNLAPLAAWVVLIAGTSSYFLARSVVRLQQCLIYAVWDTNFFEVFIISSLLVLFDVLQFQWLLSFVYSSDVPFGCMDGGCLVCPES
jgi:hypothetical protein